VQSLHNIEVRSGLLDSGLRRKAGGAARLGIFALLAGLRFGMTALSDELLGIEFLVGDESHRRVAGRDLILLL
jgi:hypothetical protein